MKLTMKDDQKKNNKHFIINCDSRKIVIHHTHLIDDMMSLLNNNDVVFFDDCLYSQYIFIKQNIKQLQDKNIICILGFSTQIYRTNQIPLIENSAILHDRVHANDYLAFGGFMTIDEIKELLSFDNIYLAGHGAKHLELEKMNLSKIQQTTLFIKDVVEMKKSFEKFNLSTDIFVFPYAYDSFPCAKLTINNLGFNYIFAAYDSQRIEIESLAKVKF